MTPGARIAAAIGLLDAIVAGAPAERELTRWARASRFAGSGDRAAVRDHVFDALRCRRSFAALGGAETGRGLMIGALRAADQPAEALFTGEGYAPAALSKVERDLTVSWRDLPELVRLDCPDWLGEALRRDLGDAFTPVMQALRKRAPVFLRANLLKATRDEAAGALASDGIATEPHPLAPTALLVTEGARRLRGSAALRDGLVEVQDAASQAVVQHLGPLTGLRVLDYCAGGGGKALAMAALGARVWAHDGDPRRMADLPPRADRAGAEVAMLSEGDLSAAGPFDLVLCDVPCSGSGAWRRQPDAKWRLDSAGLERLVGVQSSILDAAQALVAPGGRLAYATCSLLAQENGDQITAFLTRHPAWRLADSLRLTPLDGGDGFGFALLTRS